ncbi:hypothetical protein D0C36_24235 [Mucilaginibacter conchicola]|uniref:Uncharacterized protein n=1 Tax=Mucilaginibacter conchicola TaxID=2303333 RepID=A0A372NNR8_9SPHI|nr:hypothetical protein [Mucilaginibacter conchicola]RFZ89883.1 hypothetical protein D0C36_24235 [Mucilaginibacter conchicola]
MTIKFPFLNIKQKPFELFGLCAVVLFILSLVPFKQSSDINFHDTYFVFSIRSLFISCTVLFLFIWMLYLLTNKMSLSSKLSWIHTLATISTIAFLLMLPSGIISLNDSPKRYYAFAEAEQASFLNITTFYSAMAIILIVAQLLFLINIGAGLIKWALRRA